MSNFIRGSSTTPYLDPFFSYNNSDLIPEEDKLNLDYLVSQIDHGVNILKIDRLDKMQEANYYEQERNPSDFEYLKEMYGIQNPIDLRFHPLVRPHINVLKGIVASDNLDFHVTTSNPNVINKLDEEKKEFILSEMNKIFQSSQNEKNPKQYIDREINNLKDYIEMDFKSNIEIAAQDLIEYFKQNKELSLKSKRADLAEDLFKHGECYYRVYISELDKLPELEVFQPTNIWFSKQFNKKYINGCDRIVSRRFLKKREVLNKYGHLLDDDAKERLFGSNYLAFSGRQIATGSQMSFLTNTTSFQHFNLLGTGTNDIVELFHTEWLANNKIEITDPEQIEKLATVEEKEKKLKKIIRWRLDRYEGYRIGYDIYFGMGKSSWIIRDINDEFSSKLTYNGIQFSSRNGLPYSLISKTKNLQDAYDILMYHRDNLIANSGTKGSRINVAGIPKSLGTDFMERLLKFIQLKKQGVELYDPSQKGFEQFNHYGDYDGSIDYNSIQSINACLEMIRLEVTNTTGVTPQMLAQIETREAVKNVEVSMVQSSLMVKQMFSDLKELTEHMLSDMLNNSIQSFRNGIKGSYILSEGQLKLFNILPEQLSLCSFNINILDRDVARKQYEELKNLAIEFIKIGKLDYQFLTIINSSSSIAHLRYAINKYAKTNASKDSKIRELEQTLEQYEENIKELQQELKKLKDKNLEIKEKEISLREQEINNNFTIRNKELENNLELKNSKSILDVKRVELEKAQLMFGKGSEKEIRND